LKDTTKREVTKFPTIQEMIAIALPAWVLGKMSPYPTVVMVMREYQKEWRSVP
jgi:hypothetical protein